jgi:two-component system sensor histidine kinase KdpD
MRRIKFKVPDGLPLFKADPVLLAQLIGNLLENALKYSADTIDLSVNVIDKNLQVAVKDRGHEIPHEKYTSIFEPYSRNDLSGQRGAGLGLALCKAIAAAHGGTLNLRRRSGGGNSFTFAMPLDANPPEGGQP